LKPNGRDGKDGTGRSPKARRRGASCWTILLCVRFGLQAHAGLPVPGGNARLLQHRRLSLREGGGVLNRLLAFDTGRGHCRGRIFRPPRPGRNGLGTVLIAVIPSSR